MLATIAIIFYHTFNTFPQAAIANPTDMRDIFQDSSHKFYIILRSSVNIFFIISGFLLSYLTMPEIKKKGADYNWKQFILRRVLRLTPVYYTAMIIALFLMSYLGSGPQ